MLELTKQVCTNILECLEKISILESYIETSKNTATYWAGRKDDFMNNHRAALLNIAKYSQMMDYQKEQINQLKKQIQLCK
jgi:hypothetical protein